MCKVKPQCRAFVVQNTDFIAWRIAYYSVGPFWETLTKSITEKFGVNVFFRQRLGDRDLQKIDIDSISYELKQTLDVLRGEEVCCIPSLLETESGCYECYIGRHFLQIIYNRKNGNLDGIDLSPYAEVLEQLLRSSEVSVVNMVCVVHTFVKDKIDELKKKLESVVINEIVENKVVVSYYSDARNSGAFRLESNRRVRRDVESADVYRFEVMGQSRYQNLDEKSFMNGSREMLEEALLENTRYFI